MAKWRVHKTVRGTQSRAREEDQVVFKSFMYVLEKQSYMRGKERERENIFYLLVYFLNGWARPKLGVQSFI